VTNQVIPEAAVEAAADLIVQGDMGDCECRRSPYDKHDVNPPCSTRRRATRIARAALEAAAPHMLAQVWDEGYTTGNAHNGRRDSNPYGGQPKFDPHTAKPHNWV
jgi:hypothetical protein